MDLFTEHYARQTRDAFDLDIDRATQLGPLVAATTPRPPRRLARAASWFRATLHPSRQPIGTTRPATVPSSR
jgi:hypothetical protein